jgi:O-antigen/teichoic acid export membrane protein
MSLRKQAASLAIMHAADVLQPLLILPYAGRVLGPHHFGQYAYAVSLGQLAATIVEYGFHWTAQRAAASARREPAAIAALFAEVVAAKTMLCFVVTLAGLAAALVCFLMMVTSPVHLEFAVAIQSAIPLVCGAVSLPFIIPVGFGGFRSVTLSRVAMQLRNGWRGFLFSFVERASMTLPVPLVEHFAGYVAAGQYSVAEKFVGATRPFFRVISETFLPRVAYYAHNDPAAGLALIWSSLLTLVVGATLSLGLFFVAPYVIIIFFGDAFSDAIPIVRVMSIIPVLLNINICTSNLYMFNYGHERAWASLTVSGLLIFLSVAFLLSPHLSNAAIAVAVAVIAKEALVLVVSAGFFLAFGSGKARVSPTHSVASTQASGITTGSVLTSRTRAVRPWHDQLRSER